MQFLVDFESCLRVGKLIYRVYGDMGITLSPIYCSDENISLVNYSCICHLIAFQHKQIATPVLLFCDRLIGKREDSDSISSICNALRYIVLRKEV